MYNYDYMCESLQFGCLLISMKACDNLVKNILYYIFYLKRLSTKELSSVNLYVSPMTSDISTKMMIHIPFIMGPTCYHFRMFAKGFHCERLP